MDYIEPPPPVKMPNNATKRSNEVLLNRVSDEKYDEWVKVNKIQKRRIRNRESAARSRKRKADELEHLREENERLRDEVDRLRRIIGQ